MIHLSINTHNCCYRGLYLTSSATRGHHIVSFLRQEEMFAVRSNHTANNRLTLIDFSIICIQLWQFNYRFESFIFTCVYALLRGPHKRFHLNGLTYVLVVRLSPVYNIHNALLLCELH